MTAEPGWEGGAGGEPAEGGEEGESASRVLSSFRSGWAVSAGLE